MVRALLPDAVRPVGRAAGCAHDERLRAVRARTTSRRAPGTSAATRSPMPCSRRSPVFAPDVVDCVVDRQVLGPPDVEAQIGLTGGHIFQGECLPDQMWDGRFAPALRRRRPLPVRGRNPSRRERDRDQRAERGDGGARGPHRPGVAPRDRGRSGRLGALTGPQGPDRGCSHRGFGDSPRLDEQTLLPQGIAGGDSARRAA